MPKKWTWKQIHKNKDKMTDTQLENAILSTLPPHIDKIIDKYDNNEPLTAKEQKQLDDWEQSPESGPAGSIMGGLKTG